MIELDSDAVRANVDALQQEAVGIFPDSQEFKRTRAEPLEATIVCQAAARAASGVLPCAPHGVGAVGMEGEQVVRGAALELSAPNLYAAATGGGLSEKQGQMIKHNGRSLCS